MSGVLIESYGWEWSFYVPAIMSALFALASFWLVYDSPDKHPRITATELAYIQISKAGIVTGRKVSLTAIKVFDHNTFFGYFCRKIGHRLVQC